MNVTETVYSCKRSSACGFCNLLCSREIVDIHEKENALDIVTEDRVYHIVAESPEDARYKRVILLGLFIWFRSDLAAHGAAWETQSQQKRRG